MIEITNITEYIKTVSKFERGIDKTVFYRGQTKIYIGDNQPQASIFRQYGKMQRSKAEYEKKFYYEAITRFPHEFEGMSSIDRLAKMQHYGWPTRLLDFSRKPLIALYFACEDAYDDKCEKGVVYVKITSYPDKLEGEGTLSYDSDRALMLGCLARMTLKEQQMIKKFAERLATLDDVRINEGTLKNADLETQNAFGKFYSEVRRERNAFSKYNTRPQDLLNSFMLSPQFHKVQNERLSIQDGAFCIVGLNNEPLIDTTKTMIISVNAKKEILKDLDKLGINFAFIYGDLSSVARYVVQQVVEECSKIS